MHPIRGNARPALWLLLAALAGGTALHASALVSLHSYSLDDATSYLTASGNRSAYNAGLKNPSTPAGVWVPASEWQRFLGEPRPFAFRTISRDLGNLDIHPPAYFWLLGSWISIFGVHLWSGPTLNFLIHGLTGLALFQLAFWVLGSRRQAALVLLLWALSPAVARTAANTRQYALFGLFSVLLMSEALRLTEGTPGRPWRRGVGITAAALGGLLTHLQFTLVCGTAGVWMLFRSARSAPLRLAVGTVALAAAAGLAFAIFPEALDQLARQQARPVASSTAARVGILPQALAEFFFVRPSALAQGAVFALTTGVLLVSLSLGLRSRLGSWPREPRSARIAGPLFFLATLFAAIGGAYLLGLSPDHAMKYRYLSPLWPAFAFVPVLAWRWLPWRPRRVRLAGGAALVVLLVANASAVRMSAPGDPARALAGVERVVFGSPTPGRVLPLVAHLAEKTPILVADRSALAAEIDGWLDPDCRACLYAHAVPGVSEQTDPILEGIRAVCPTRSLVSPLWRSGTLYCGH